MTDLPLGRGARGEAVRDLQRRLNALGQGGGDGEAGEYGPATEAAVTAFQRSAGLDVDGRCDTVTWHALVEAGYQLGDRQIYLRSPMMRGDDIVELQRSLSALGFHDRRVDGIFGPDTAASLAEFQRNCVLPSDGIFGPESLAALQRLGRARVGALGVASVRERELLRNGTGELTARRVVVGEPGGLGALAAVLTRLLRDAGSVAMTVDHPDWSQQARDANTLEADVYLGLRLQAGAGADAAYFAIPGFASAGGRLLAELATVELDEVLGCRGVVTGMRLPVLRETRMPAVLVSLGPPSQLVQRTAEVAEALARAVRRWTAEALEGDAPRGVAGADVLPGPRAASPHAPSTPSRSG
ncbi:MAG: hypothetical protein GEV08_20965 [Acidimicrobiia bacterium]|nr:hypothetical protein [Acidimicrobiia bacterium]